jgi:splicing factor 3B subunit 1
MFHPARRVRETYWRHYNALVVGSAPALVPAWPTPPDEGGARYARADLQVFI